MKKRTFPPRGGPGDREASGKPPLPGGGEAEGAEAEAGGTKGRTAGGNGEGLATRAGSPAWPALLPRALTRPRPRGRLTQTGALCLRTPDGGSGARQAK